VPQVFAFDALYPVFCNQLFVFFKTPWEESSAFFLGGCRGMHTPKHFVNLMQENKNFKMLEFLLNQL
jgi:hypothetical protein